MADQAEAQKIPLVNLWLNSPAVNQLPTVVPDYTQIGRCSARHLIARGLREIGFVGFQRDRGCREQFGGVSREASAAGFSVSRLLVRPSYNRNAERWAEYQSQINGWIDSWTIPFGLAATSDLMARYLAEACRHRKLRVPEDVAIIGTGDELPICLHPEPSLTSIDCGYKQTGFRVAELLDTLMDGGIPDAAEVLDNCRVVGRHSTDVFAVEDPIVAGALRYISENCHEPINVSDVARHAPASRRSLERRFSKVLQRTIAQEINRMRIGRLERLLVSSDESLEALAVMCGFTDTDQMRHHFVRIRGVKPSEYRRQF